MKTRKSLMTKGALLLLILVLPFNIIGIAEAVFSYQSAVASAQEAISHSMDLYISLLDNRLSNTDTLLYDMAFLNPNYSEYLGQGTEAVRTYHKYNLSTALRTRMTIADVADEIFIYDAYHDDSLKVPFSSDSTEDLSPYTDYIENYSTLYSKWFLSTEGDPYLLRIFQDKASGAYYGASIQLNDITEDIAGLLSYNTTACSFRTAPMPEEHGKIVLNTYIRDNIYLTVTISSREFGHSINIIQTGLILFFGLYLLLVPVLILLLRRYVGKPLSVLNDAHRQLQEGNDDYRIGTDANSLDFENAYHSFNTMAQSLQELQAEIIETEKANKQLQIDYLQLQIRPHFLLNSFNVLYTLIQNGQKEPAHDMVLFLSDYFRYLFRSGRELQLFSKELKLIRDYLAITKIYYPQAFDISYQLDPVLDLMRVPPLLLHSFIENIIQHALRPDRQVHIVFSGEYEDGIVTFYISDDGSGMESTAIEAINHIDTQPIDDGRNVGIKNSIRRLKYYYGPGAAAEVDSELNVGTTFTITIPYDLEEDDEAFDCE